MPRIFTRQTGLNLLAAIGAILSAVFSFPLLFLIDRGNIEGIVWIVSSAALALFVFRRYASASLLFALAASMKIFPGVLLLLLLARKRYREFAVGAVAVVTWTCIALIIAGPTPLRAAEGIGEGLAFLREIQIFNFQAFEINFDHSLFAVVKQILFRAFHDIPHVKSILPGIYLPYALAAVSAFALLYARHIRRQPIVNQVLALSALSVLLPYVSYDYTLVHMIGPFILLIYVLSREAADLRLSPTPAQMLFLLLPFGVLFTPQNYLVHSVIGYAGQLKALALLSIVASAVLIPVPAAIFNERSQPAILLLPCELPVSIAPIPAIPRTQTQHS